MSHIKKKLGPRLLLKHIANTHINVDLTTSLCVYHLQNVSKTTNKRRCQNFAVLNVFVLVTIIKFAQPDKMFLLDTVTFFEQENEKVVLCQKNFSS